MPLRLNGEHTHITDDIIKIEQVLQEKWPSIPIHTMDERLTSKMAHQSLIDSGVPKQKRKEKGALDSGKRCLNFANLFSKNKMILPIVAYGSQVLRAKTEEIEASYPDLKELLEDMYETMEASNGIGLAAPQVGKAIRLFLVDCHCN